MKKIILIAIVLVFLFFTFMIIGAKATENDNASNIDEIRAVYFSYIEFNSYIKGKKSEESKNNIKNILDNIKNMNLNTIIVHVRPFSDSIYKSKYYPISDTILNNNNEVPDYDVLDFFITEAHSRNLKIEAWINPFRISNDTKLDNISVDSIYYKFINSSDAMIINDKGIYLNPASVEVRSLIIDGIKEIVANYDIDGIHFDDYFYPNESIDLKSYDEYIKNGGTMSLNEYRLNNISILIKDTYSSIKNIKPDVKFGIAPEGNIENNYDKSFLDVNKILSNEGYIDYIMPQLYFGFENETKPFIDTINIWNSLIEVDSIDLIPALAFYKIGTVDTYALSGKNEWIENSDIIKKQIVISRNVSNYDGFSLFRYDYIFNKDKLNENIEKEIMGLKEVL